MSLVYFNIPCQCVKGIGTDVRSYLTTGGQPVPLAWQWLPSHDWQTVQHPPPPVRVLLQILTHETKLSLLINLKSFAIDYVYVFVFYQLQNVSLKMEPCLLLLK